MCYKYAGIHVVVNKVNKFIGQLLSDTKTIQQLPYNDSKEL